MSEKRYYLEDDSHIEENKRRLICCDDEGGIYRFDKSTGRWEEDWSLTRIYIGELDVDPISEEEAMRLIDEVYLHNDKGGK